jgi:sigma-E factor negative regulatory protein RseB
MIGGAAAALVLLWGTTAADAAACRDAHPTADPEAMRLLSKAGGAARATAYQGTEYMTSWYSAASTTSLLDVAHTPGDGTFMKSGGAKGGPGAVSFESDAAADQAAAGAISTGRLDLLAANYTVIRVADGSACGRPAMVIEARRADGTVAGRFWIDRDTGVLLHRDLLDGQGRTVISTGFQNFDVVPAQAGAGRTGDDHTVSGLMGSNVSLWGRGTGAKTLSGWRVPRTLPENLSLFQTRSTSDPDTVQMAYSDGLSSVSVFVQRGRLNAGRLSGWRRALVHGHPVFERDGQHRWAVWDAGGQVYTVLADAPQATADAVVAALPHGGGSGDGFWRRLWRGGDRLATWLNPFG